MEPNGEEAGDDMAGQQETKAMAEAGRGMATKTGDYRLWPKRRKARMTPGGKSLPRPGVTTVGQTAAGSLRATCQ